MTVYPNSPLPMRPGKVTALGIMTLISGILNIMLGFTLVITLIAGLVTILCAPIGLLPIALGIFEIIHASKLMSSAPRLPFRPNQTIFILEICSVLFLGITSCVLGIVNLVFSNDPEVIQYYNILNGA